MTLGNNYLKSIKKEFLQYKALAEKAIQQLEPGQLFHVSNNYSNSIAGIIKHLHGNMLSRWTDFLTTDGEKPWRDRDAEFENTFTDKKEVLRQWEEGWNCLFAAIDSLDEDRLMQIIYIREETHTVVEALNRQLAHYSSHVGQIIFAAKQLTTTEWQPLSIPKKIK